MEVRTNGRYLDQTDIVTLVQEMADHISDLEAEKADLEEAIEELQEEIKELKAQLAERGE